MPVRMSASTDLGGLRGSLASARVLADNIVFHPYVEKAHRLTGLFTLNNYVRRVDAKKTNRDLPG